MQNKSAILQMLNGRRGYREFIKPSKEYLKSLNEAAKNETELLAKLSTFPELLELYKKTCDSADASNDELVDTYYIEGFKFGFLMGMEVAE